MIKIKKQNITHTGEKEENSSIKNGKSSIYAQGAENSLQKIINIPPAIRVEKEDRKSEELEEITENLLENE